MDNAHDNLIEIHPKSRKLTKASVFIIKMRKLSDSSGTSIPNMELESLRRTNKNRNFKIAHCYQNCISNFIKKLAIFTVEQKFLRTEKSSKRTEKIQ